VTGGHILTEAADFLCAENGDRLVTEDFVPDVIAVGAGPGFHFIEDGGHERRPGRALRRTDDPDLRRSIEMAVLDIVEEAAELPPPSVIAEQIAAAPAVAAYEAPLALLRELIDAALADYQRMQAEDEEEAVIMLLAA
jgi:hypothetical protein